MAQLATKDVKNYRRNASDSYETDFTAQTCSPKSLSETRSKCTVPLQGFVYDFGFNGDVDIKSGGIQTRKRSVTRRASL